MAFELAKLFVTITGNSAPLSASLNNIRGQLTGLTGQFGSLGSQISSGILAPLIGMSGGLTTMATAMGVGLAAAATAGIGKAVMLASDLREATNKCEVAFGSYSKKVISQADQMAAKLGIVKKTFLDAVSNFGLKLEGIGFGNKEAADMSLKLMQRAIDMKSITNTPFEEVVARMFSGLNGELEAVGKWGVNMSEANVKLKAMTMGLSNGTKELDQQAKTLARYNILLEGTAYAEGDAARTSKEFAWQLEILKGHVQNLTTEIGDKFLPIETHAVHTANAALDAMADKTSLLHRIWDRLSTAFAAPFYPLMQGMENAFSVMDYFLGRTEEAAVDTQASVDARIKASQAQMKADAATAAAVGSKRTTWHGGLAEYYNKVFEGAAGEKDKQAALLQVAKQGVAVQQQILQAVNKPAGAAVALAN